MLLHGMRAFEGRIGCPRSRDERPDMEVGSWSLIQETRVS